MTRDCPLKPSVPPWKHGVRYAREWRIGASVCDVTRMAASTYIDQRLETLLVLFIDHAHQRSIDPASCFDRVETANEHVELHVVALVLVLYLADVRIDLTARHALHDEVGCHRGLGLTDVALSEEELAVEVGDVDGVHINHVDALEARQGQVLENLTS